LAGWHVVNPVHKNNKPLNEDGQLTEKKEEKNLLKSGLDTAESDIKYVCKGISNY